MEPEPAATLQLQSVPPAEDDVEAIRDTNDSITPGMASGAGPELVAVQHSRCSKSSGELERVCSRLTRPFLCKPHLICLQVMNQRPPTNGTAPAGECGCQLACIRSIKTTESRQLTAKLNVWHAAKHALHGA